MGHGAYSCVGSLTTIHENLSQLVAESRRTIGMCTSPTNSFYDNNNNNRGVVPKFRGQLVFMTTYLVIQYQPNSHVESWRTQHSLNPKQMGLSQPCIARLTTH